MISKRHQCQVCSKFFWQFDRYIFWLHKLFYGCLSVFSYRHKPWVNDKAKFIATNSPGCCCESSKVSPHSPGPIQDNELIARFAFVPVHFTNSGKIKPSLFSHVFKEGCSIQRNSIAKNEELSNWLTDLLEKNSHFVWKGVVIASSSAIRNVCLESKKQSRSLCLYDTANNCNSSHGEIFIANPAIEEADKLEIKAELMRCFDSTNLISPDQYKEGTLWGSLLPEHQQRQQ